MSKNLFIRISAVTYDEKDVLKMWPKLFALVWPDDQPDKTKGVIELSYALVDTIKYTNLSPSLRVSLSPLLPKIEDSLSCLDDALGNVDVAKAKKAADKIESLLDEAEQLCA